MGEQAIYVCRVCHRVDQRPLTCHPGKMLRCNTGAPGDERSKPLFDARGRLVTRAPKWWVDACQDEIGGVGGEAGSRRHK